MEEAKNIENSFFETLTDDSLELGGEIGELTIDQFIDNDFLKEIPFFSILYKSVKTVRGIREALFVMKVYKFMKEFQHLKQENKNKFAERIGSYKKEKTRVGQVLIMILDKIDELEKTKLIANVFAAYLKAEISLSEFTQMCSIIQNTFLDYLFLFDKMKKLSDIDLETQYSLAFSGLMMPIVNDIKSMYENSVIIDENNYMIVYVVSKIGMKIKKHAFGTILESKEK